MANVVLRPTATTVAQNVRKWFSTGFPVEERRYVLDQLKTCVCQSKVIGTFPSENMRKIANRIVSRIPSRVEPLRISFVITTICNIKCVKQVHLASTETI